MPYPQQNFTNAYQNVGQALTTASGQLGDFADKQAKLKQLFDEMVLRRAESIRQQRQLEQQEKESQARISAQERESSEKTAEQNRKNSAAKAQKDLIQNGTPGKQVPGPWAVPESERPAVGAGMPTRMVGAGEPPTANQVLAAGAEGMDPYHVAALYQKPELQELKNQGTAAVQTMRGITAQDVARMNNENRVITAKIRAAVAGAKKSGGEKDWTFIAKTIPPLLREAEDKLLQWEKMKPDNFMENPVWQATYGDLSRSVAQLRKLGLDASKNGALPAAADSSAYSPPGTRLPGINLGSDSVRTEKWDRDANGNPVKLK